MDEITFKELEDARIHHYFDKHNELLGKVNDVDRDNAGTFMLARCEEWYSQARLYAYLIAGHYVKLQRYHESMAEQAQADAYEKARFEEKKNSTDAQYLSRKAKGLELEKASRWEGDVTRWKGIAASYEGMVNSLKDMIKAKERESAGGV